MKKNKDNIVPLSEIGEFSLIKKLTENISLKNKSSIFGVGDDAAVLGYGPHYQLVTTDFLTEGIHFNLMYSPLKHLGYKAAVVNFSDIYAMNGMPRQMVVSVALSAKFSLAAIEELYDGMKLACENYGVDLVGGDTTSSLTGLHISITVIGAVEKEKIAYRGGAGKTDLVCVSGDLGAAYLGVQLLERERKIYEENPAAQPQLDGYDYVLERQLKPEARADVIEALQNQDILPSAMIDISDGLSSEILHICQQSSKGCKIFLENIPIHPETRRVAGEMNMEPMVTALNGGEDYELLFTVPVENHEKIKSLDGITILGHMASADEGIHLVNPDGSQVPLKAEGWSSL